MSENPAGGALRLEAWRIAGIFANVSLTWTKGCRNMLIASYVMGFVIVYLVAGLRFRNSKSSALPYMTAIFGLVK